MSGPSNYLAVAQMDALVEAYTAAGAGVLSLSTLFSNEPATRVLHIV